MLRPCSLLLLWQVALRLTWQVVAASLCLGGSDIFASVPENSPMGRFVSDIIISADPGAHAVRLCLTGPHADWFYLEGRSIRLNTSASRVLDRELLGSVLIAELTCSEDDVVQTHYRILVEILNENDNMPAFLQETIQPFTLSELTVVNSVVFSVEAVDGDGDTISYIIDQSLPDADFFRIDLPNIGNVILNKPLDYETKAHLQLLLWAQESNTAEKFNTSAVLSITISDGDDHYPHFLPCTPVAAGVPVCMNPTYSTNITQRHQDAVLEFSPGPIRAQDGDRGINAPLIYTILSGDDEGRFVMNNRTGDITLTRAATDLQKTRNFTLSVMVYQADDRLKYSVASVLVRVLYENAFPPTFNEMTFKGFIIQSSSPASIVSTFGNQVLQVQVSDRDFSDGPNPNVHYALRPPSGLYQVTQDGVLLARTDRLHVFDRHILQVEVVSEPAGGPRVKASQWGTTSAPRTTEWNLPRGTNEVVARDEESGEEAAASVDIEVLQRGQTVPRGAVVDQPRLGPLQGPLAGVAALMMLLLFLTAVLVLLVRTVRRGRLPEPQDVAGARKQSSVRALWSQAVNATPPIFMEWPPSDGSPGLYTRRLSQPPDPAGRCRFQTDLFSVVERPAGAGHTWEIVMTPHVTGESAGCHGDDITEGTGATPQADEDVKTSQSEETLQERAEPVKPTSPCEDRPITEQDKN